ncbi:MAG: hypothetical protein ACT4TC_04820 [Myxococcaceae bacterium]
MPVMPRLFPLLCLALVACGQGVPSEPTDVARSALMSAIRSRSAHSLAGLELAKYLEQHRPHQTVTRNDLLAVTQDSALPLTVRLAAKVAVENFDQFDSGNVRPRQLDGQVSYFDARAIRIGAFNDAPPASAAAAALVGEVLLKGFGKLDQPSRDWTSPGLLDLTELDSAPSGDEELELAAKAGRELFQVFDAAGEGDPPDLRVGMTDLEAVIARGVASLSKDDPASAVRGAYVRIGPPYGDPAYGSISLRFEWDDQRFREVCPGFDGLEKVFADVPGFGRRVLGHQRAEDGVDIYATSIGYQLGAEDKLRNGEVRFSVSTNTGELPDLVVAEKTDRPLD